MVAYDGAMAAGHEGFDEQRRPSSQQIVEELELLRRDHGISPTKIEAQAPSLLRLPVVEDQQRLKQLDPRDRHLEAYSAIGCVIDFAISDYEMQTILVLSMRYDPSLLRVRPNPEWEGVIRTTSLNQRHKFIQSLLFYGKTTYFDRLNVAYRELANQLVLRDHSPCRQAGAEQLAKSLMAATMQELLLLFSTHGQSILMETIAKEALPRVESKWKVARTTSYWAFAHAIELAITSEYRKRTERVYGSDSARWPNWDTTPLPPDALIRVMLKDRDLPLIDRVSAEVGVTDPPSRFTRSGRPLPAEEGYNRFRVSLRLLAFVVETDVEARPAAGPSNHASEVDLPRPQET